jgi:thiol-disulfide isomerase/thioredoxin
MAPFFIKVKSLIQYTKDHIDSAMVKYYEFEDSTKIKIYFKDKIAEFMGLKTFIIPSKGKISQYEIVIDKSFLPYKLIRKMPHQTSWETCSNIQVSTNMDFEFSSLQQIPADFKIKGRERGKPKSYELEGTKAPDWKLKEIYGDSISLSQIKKKVILLQFTGIGCGPCHSSIPFLKKLASDYNDKDFTVVSIETWSNNIGGIERYKDKNKMNYRFLVSKTETKDRYKIQGVPTFFILDRKRMIKKVVVGYQEGETDREIIKIIEDML